jgi:aspartyl-tRNA(Asn)/glutamyl-tRNA(Gln) amidotransferase subunit A
MHGALASLGSDTGGSIRQPASYCGVVGLKPTYGSVSRHGLMAMGSSLDVIGPIANTVSDCEIIFNAIKNDTSDSANGISGDRYDSTSIGTDEYQKIADTHVKKVDAPLRIGITPSLIHSGGVSLDVIKNYEQSVEKLKKAGCEIVEVDNDLSNIKYSLPVYYVLIFAEVSSNMARFDGVKYGSKVEGKDLLEDYLFTRGNLLGKEVRRRIMLGTYVLSSGYYDAYYNKANIVRDLIRTDFKKAFESVDVILTPTAPTPAFEIGAHASDPLQMYLEDIFTVTANLVGVPAISIPSGMIKLGDNQLPLGIQFTAPHCREDLLFEVGKLFESIRE